MAAALTIRTIKRAFWNVLATDTAGASVRAALGAGADGIITRRRFKQLPHPRAPFVVIHFGAVPGQPQFVREFFPTLWLYDDALHDWERLDDLAVLIEATYPRDAIAYCDTRYAGGIGDEVTEDGFQIPAMAMRYQVRGRF